MIATRVRQLREGRDLDVGQLSYISGVSGAHIYRIESGERPNVSGVILKQLAEALATTTDYLVGLTDDPEPRPSPQSLSAVERAAGDPLFREVVEAWPDLNGKDRSVLCDFAQAAATLRRRERGEEEPHRYNSVTDE